MPSREKAKRSPVRPKPDWISSAISTMPLSSQNLRSAWANSTSMARNPASPCTGSTIKQATSSTSISTLNRRSMALRASPQVTPLSRLGKGR
ncbi:hypothetical protein D9M69_502410 [compost metagenome]